MKTKDEAIADLIKNTDKALSQADRFSVGAILSQFYIHYEAIKSHRENNHGFLVKVNNETDCMAHASISGNVIEISIDEANTQ